MMRRTAFAGLAILSATAPAGARAPWPDDFIGRLEALALVETLNAQLLAGRSATLVLEKWCADHHMAAEPKIVAHVAAGAIAPPSAEQRERLGVGAEEPVKYRRVALACGAHTLSEADNWYVPSRLTPEMNRALETSDTPFGKVIAPLRPFRRTFSVEMRWSPLPAGWEGKTRETIMRERPKGDELDAPHALFEHRAIVHGGDGKPISEVRETYTNELLDFDAAAVRER
jgi:chorismate-pyruvate lyase